MTMRGFHLEILLLVAVTTFTTATGIVYVTDLPSFSSLAPCAGSAVSYVVNYLTNNDCQPDVTVLESCACTKDSNSVAVSSSISSLVFEYCASTATDDVLSASQVFSNYCNQGAAAVTQPAGTNTVSQYVTDLPAFSLLGPCAGSALSYVVMSLTNNDCPSGQAPLESCACTKNQNSLAVSERINSMVLEECGSTHAEDVTSAQGVFAGYCGLGNGTSSFPSTSVLAGDVTYYITDLPEFSSLAPCAGSAVSYEVLSQTNLDCPAAPDALVSCACVKDQNSLGLSSRIASMVSGECGSTASDDVSSALSVFAYYCSAGNALVTPQGVTASVTTTAFGGVGGGAKTTPNAFPTQTSTGTGSSSSGTNISNSSSGGSNVPIGAIVGGAAGAVVLILLILITSWKYRRNHRPPIGPVNPGWGNSFSSPPPPPNSHLYGAPQMVHTPMNPVQRPIMRKPAPVVRERPLVSPIEMTGANGARSPPTSPSPAQSLPVPSPPAPVPAEVPATVHAAEMQGVHDPVEVQNNQLPKGTELPGRNLEAVEMSATSGPFELVGQHEWRD